MEFKRPRRLSKNIEDRRGSSPARGSAGRTRGRPGAAAGVGGAGGLAAVVALLVAMCSGGGGGGLPGSGFDVSAGGLSGGAAPASGDLEAPLDPSQDPNRDEAELASVVLDSTQEYWTEVFESNGLTYREATLVLFTGATPTGCGQGSAATGPFYCSLDETAYIDLSFWDTLEQQLGAGGDFAQAYVIAHEIGHHVQNVLGISDQVRQQRSTVSQSDGNALSVRQELQADCFAGAWAGVVFDTGDEILLDEEDIREALDAAAAVGDDRIQEATTGYVDPHKWTHGSADQRMDWFTRGFESGDPNVCDTFS